MKDFDKDPLPEHSWPTIGLAPEPNVWPLRDGTSYTFSGPRHRAQCWARFAAGGKVHHLIVDGRDADDALQRLHSELRRGDPDLEPERVVQAVFDAAEVS